MPQAVLQRGTAMAKIISIDRFVSRRNDSVPLVTFGPLQSLVQTKCKVSRLSHVMQQQASDIILYPSRWKMALLALGSLLFVLSTSLVWASGALFLQAVAVTGILFFGYAFVFALGRLLRPRPSLVIDNRGITDNVAATGVGFIAWNEIAEVGMGGRGLSRFIVIIPHDPEAILARQSPIKRSVLRANMGLVGSPITIPGSLPISLDEVLAFIQARLAER